jgi:hypothetical protein
MTSLSNSTRIPFSCASPLHHYSAVLTARFRQRATETAHKITTVATSSFESANARVHQLSDNMLSELQKLQASTASISESFQATATTATSTVRSHIPPHIQEAFSEFSQNLSNATAEFSSTITAKDIPLQEKASKLASEVRERIVPLLGSLTKGVGDAFNPKSGPASANGNAPETDDSQPMRSKKGKVDVTNDQPESSR